MIFVVWKFGIWQHQPWKHVEVESFLYSFVEENLSFNFLVLFFGQR